MSTEVAGGHHGPADSVEARQSLVEALELDLVGPWPGHAYSDEELLGWQRPSTWYLTGFLVPAQAPEDQRSDPEQADELDAGPDQGGLPEESMEERRAAKRAFFPSSMGLSFLVDAGQRELQLTVSWGDYTRGESEHLDKEGKPFLSWRRTPREASFPVELTGAGEPRVVPVTGSDGLVVHVSERPIATGEWSEQLPPGVRAVSVFLVNQREPHTGEPDQAFAFQPVLEVHSDRPFVPRPDLRGVQANHRDEQLADLHYADAPSYATGHGVSVGWTLTEGACLELRTRWVPSAEVEQTKTAALDGVQLEMEALGSLHDGAALRAALEPLVAQYRTWIEKQRESLDALSESRAATARILLHEAGVAADRMAAGLGALAGDEDALDAFRVANRAVARALRRRLGDQLEGRAPAWRPFQLAFVLLNLPGLVDPEEPQREIVDLLFFPTGGGKTEAYLGLAAFTMVLRRLRHPGDGGLAGTGVSVIMRYTLRLLTLDQLSRAAGLVCALELERADDPGRYGSWPFEIGLWVGKAATPNRMGHKGDKRQDTARSKVLQYQKNPKIKPVPIPLEACPWCGQPFEPGSFDLVPTADAPEELRIVCHHVECDFNGDRPLPIVAVDEPLYRRLPAFLIATVDKFASLPWVGESGLLLGGAERASKDGFFGPASPPLGTRLSQPLPPPDLIIQDELHLIAGPLGTMAGLYETAIEALCLRGTGVRPKIVASTATVRRAQDQIQALFGRPQTCVFPPPGPDRRDSFFARVVPVDTSPGRLYLGVAAQGRNPKVVLYRVWRALMCAAERLFVEAGGTKQESNPVDPYMTVLGYFNSLRELGGARRILEEQIQNTIKGYGGRRRRLGRDERLFRDRRTFGEVVELTSRVPTEKVAEARQRLGQPFHPRRRVDCAIATNMISVGLDIPRLGLMVVAGQPKTHAEYIQASSRVGRDDKRPGLVVTLLNIHKPRDRSHYESFRHYHETFYRAVEVGSVTPFSARALDRGLTGALFALARHALGELTPAQGVERLAEHRAEVERRLRDVFLRRVQDQPVSGASGRDEQDEWERSVQNRIVHLLDTWLGVLGAHHAEGVAMQYQCHEESGRQPLLREMLDPDPSPETRLLRVNRSLRDVETEVDVFVTGLPRKVATTQQDASA